MQQKLTRKQQYWSDLLVTADSSGMSLTEFSKANQIAPQTLYRWRSQLKKYSIEATESITQFSKVVATSYPAQPGLSVNVQNAQLQFIELPNPEWLARFLSYQGSAT